MDDRKVFGQVGRQQGEQVSVERHYFISSRLFGLRRLLLTLLQREKTAKMGLKAKRLKAGWDNDYLLRALAAQQDAIALLPFGIAEQALADEQRR